MRRACLIVLSLIILAIAPPYALAGEFRLVRDRYSTTRPVPHIAFEGEVEKGDAAKLRAMITRFCPDASDCEFDNTTAILSLDSDGGSFVAGIELAETLRALQVATVVESNNACLSACALAFLGGSGFHVTGGIGTYVDRFMEPDARVGFHSPFTEQLAGLSDNLKLDLTVRGLRVSIADLARFLMRYNVDPIVVDRIIMMEPDQFYDITTFADLFYFRVNLSEFPGHLAEPPVEQRIHNVCSRLAALHYSAEIAAIRPIIADGFSKAVAHTRNGVPLDGFDVDDRPLNVAWCGLQDETTSYDDLSESFTISLARMAWKEDMSDTYAEPLVSFNYSNSGWNSAGYRGGTAARSILRLGPINHWFYEPEMEISSLGRAAKTHIQDDKRVSFAPFERWRDRLLTGLDFQTFTHNQRRYQIGEISAEVEVGPASRFDHAFKRYQGLRNTQITYSRTFENAFVVSGLQPDGRAFYTFGLKDEDASLVAMLEFPLGADGKPSDETNSQIDAIACSASFGSASLPCN